MIRERLCVRRHAVAAVLVAFALAVTAACTERPSYSSLSAGAEPLRTRFNQDAGKVRIIMLPAPT